MAGAAGKLCAAAGVVDLAELQGLFEHGRQPAG